jgi:hypothetical protein
MQRKTHPLPPELTSIKKKKLPKSQRRKAMKRAKEARAITTTRSNQSP